jgi:putative transposase
VIRKIDNEEPQETLPVVQGDHAGGRAARAGEVTLGGRRVGVQRPRARAANGSGEVPLRTYQHFADRDPLSRTVPERVLAGVFTRRYGRTQEPVGEELERAARSSSESAVSRTFR